MFFSRAGSFLLKIAFRSIIAEEINYTFFKILDDSVVHNIGLWLGTTHLQNAIELTLVLLVLLHQVEVCLLDNLNWIAKNLNTSLNSRCRFRDIVHVGIARFA